MDLDTEDLQHLSNAELFDYRCRIEARIAELRALKHKVDEELGQRAPLRIGQDVVLPGSMKWKPFDPTFAAVRNWCGDADTFLLVAHVDYVRTSSIADLAKHRALGEGDSSEAAESYAETILSSLGEKVLDSAPVTVLPLAKAARKWASLPDELEVQSGV